MSLGRKSNILAAGLLALALMPLGPTDPAEASSSVLLVPAEFDTVQEAIDAAQAGDTVLVAPGTYHERIDFAGKAIRVEGEGGATQTIIDADSLGPVVRFDKGEDRDAVLVGFTLTHGEAQVEGSYVRTGGGIVIRNASPTISAVVVEDSQACTGGGIYVSGGSPLVEGTVIRNNRTQFDQSTDQPYCWETGGGVFAQDSGIEIRDSKITGNQSDGDGGGLNLMGTGIVVEGNLISGNRGNQGGGLRIYAEGAGCRVTDNIVERNGARGPFGGGIWAAGGSSDGELLIEGNVVRLNWGPGQGGGIDAGYTTVLRNNLVVGNRCSSSGCQMRLNSNSRAANNTIVETSGSSLIQVDLTGTALLENSVVVGSGDWVLVRCREQSQLRYSLAYYGGIAPSLSGCEPTDGIITAPPGFVLPGADYHLLPDSAAVDAGLNALAPATDLDGTPRPLDGNGDGVAVADLGAYEVQPQSLAGTLIGASTQTAAWGVCVEVWPETGLGVGAPIATTTAGESGGYFVGVPVGSYTLRFVDCSRGVHATTWYNENPGTPGFSVVTVAAGERREGLDMTLPIPRRCSGRAITILGSRGDDHLQGTSGPDVVDGLEGDDTIEGLDGDDVLCGGDGDDVLDGGAGSDVLLGGRGDDELAGAEGDDLVRGQGGSDVLSGGPGTDVLNGGVGRDVLDYAAATGPIVVNLSQQVADGEGLDTLNSFETVTGSGFDDTIVGTARRDRLNGEGGSDTILGLGGADLIDGGPGADSIDGGGGDDRISGGSGRDLILGGAGKDRINGGGGDDQLAGGPDDDILLGRAGDNYLVGEGGDDLLSSAGGDSYCLGGPGDDTIDGSGPGTAFAYYHTARRPIRADAATGIATGDGTDRLLDVYGVVGSEYDDTITGFVWADGGPGDDTIVLGGWEGISFRWLKGYGYTGNDHITGSDDHPDELWGEDGDDHLVGLNYSDYLEGAAGWDELDAGSGSEDICVDGEVLSGCEYHLHRQAVPRSEPDPERPWGVAGHGIWPGWVPGRDGERLAFL